MRILSTITRTALSLFLSASFNTALAGQDRNLIDTFLGGGLGTNTTYLSANNQATGYETKIEEKNSSLNLFLEAGVKINTSNFFLSPRFTYYTSNQKMSFSPAPGVDVMLYNERRYDFDLMIGKYYKNMAFYAFGGRSVIDFSQKISVVDGTIDIKVRQHFVGLGFEYSTANSLSFFGEISYYKANKDDIRIQVMGQDIPDSDRNQIDPKIETAKLKIGARFYPAYF